MAELVILNVPQDALSRVRYLTNNGHQEAQRWLKVELWKRLPSPASYATEKFISECKAELT